MVREKHGDFDKKLFIFFINCRKTSFPSLFLVVVCRDDSSKFHSISHVNKYCKKTFIKIIFYFHLKYHYYYLVVLVLNYLSSFYSTD